MIESICDSEKEEAEISHREREAGRKRDKFISIYFNHRKRKKQKTEIKNKIFIDER